MTPVAANTLPSTLGDFAASTINGTYAVPYGLIPSRDALLIEKQDENGENPYVNVIVARTADKDNEVYQKVVEAYQTQLVAEFLLVNYHETFYPAFAYDADAAFSVTEENVAEISGYKSSKDGKTVVKVGVCGGVGNSSGSRPRRCSTTRARTSTSTLWSLTRTTCRTKRSTAATST